MTSSPFIVSIADLVAEPGARRPEDLEAVVEWGVDLAAVGPGLRAQLVLENASGTIVVRGQAESVVGFTCHRCLTEWEEDRSVDVVEALGIEGDDDGYEVDGDEVDLEPILRDAILLELPLRPLCREGCLGLCATCGADLNTGACPGHESEAGSPFAGLRDLLEP